MRPAAIVILTIVASTVLGQNQSWEQKLEVYRKDVVPMKIGITFHQPYYAAGDTAHFALYFLNARLVPITSNQILSVHLVAPSGKIIQSLSLLVKDGWTANQLVIPIDIEPGLYRVVAYCDWMRNFERGLWCQEFLYITNGKTFIQEFKSTLKAAPEGGELVPGVSNRIFVQGKPDGYVTINSNGAEVTRFSLNQLGFGSATLLPQINQVFSISSGSDRIELTAAKDGISIFLINPPESTQALRVGLQLNKETTLSKAPIQMAIIHQDELLYLSEINLKNRNQILIPISKETFPSGISTIYLFQHDRVLAQRMFYIEFNRSQVDVNLNSTTVNARNNLTLEISLKDEKSSPIDGRLTVKIYKKKLFNAGTVSPLVHQLKIKSDLLDDPNWHPVVVDKKVQLSSLDALLCLQNYPRFNPEKVYISNKTFDFRQELRISGIIKNPETGHPLPATLISMYLSKNNILAETITNDKGEFSGSLIQYFYGSQETFFRAEKNGVRTFPIKVDINTDTINFIKLPDTKFSSEEDAYYQYRRFREMIQSSYAEYSTSSIKQPEDFLKDPLPEADTEVDLDDYLRFPTMAETIKEIIPLMTHRVVKDKNEVRVYISELFRSGKDDPIYNIDGVMTDDTDYFLRLKPSEVDKVKLIYELDKLEKFGRIGQHGIVVVETKIPGNAANVPRSSAHYDWTGLSRPYRFNPSLTISKNSRIPQLTPVLHWEPNLSIKGGKATLNIPTSDDLGVYKVVIEGISALGDGIYKELEFEIIDPDIR